MLRVLRGFDFLPWCAVGLFLVIWLSKGKRPYVVESDNGPVKVSGLRPNLRNKALRESPGTGNGMCVNDVGPGDREAAVAVPSARPPQGRE